MTMPIFTWNGMISSSMHLTHLSRCPGRMWYCLSSKIMTPPLRWPRGHTTPDSRDRVCTGSCDPEPARALAADLARHAAYRVRRGGRGRGVRRRRAPAGSLAAVSLLSGRRQLAADSRAQADPRQLGAERPGYPDLLPAA